MTGRVVAGLMACLLCTGLLLNGCGKSAGRTDSSSGKEPAFQSSASFSADVTDNGQSSSEEVPAEPTPTPEPVVQKSKVKKNARVYSDNIRNIKTLGLKEYKELKSDRYDAKKKKGLLDKPAKGKKYLVLFLSVENTDKEDLYFHVNYLSAKVDGKKIENTFLLNDPEGYRTIFRTIKAGDFNEGFIVWEVPKDWKKLEITFKGFEPYGGKCLKLTATRKSLKDPDAPSKMEE